jgi:hypothetical protein
LSQGRVDFEVLGQDVCADVCGEAGKGFVCEVAVAVFPAADAREVALDGEC